MGIGGGLGAGGAQMLLVGAEGGGKIGRRGLEGKPGGRGGGSEVVEYWGREARGVGAAEEEEPGVGGGGGLDWG